jgi:hypothetical protein
MGQKVEEAFFLDCLTHCRLRKVPEDRRPHFYCGENLRSRIKLSFNRRSVINLIYVHHNRMYGTKIGIIAGM